MVFATSMMSSRTAGVTAPVSRCHSWNRRMMPSQCRLSSRTDQLTIWPMPFILLWRGKLSSMAKLANSDMPSVKAPNIASVRATSAQVATPKLCM